jgi:hypothetical protein
MTIDPQWLIVGGVAAVVGAIAVVHSLREKKRRASYEEFCGIRGFRYEAERPEGERRFRDAFEQFNQGHGRKWTHTLTGSKNGVPFIVYEYKWVTGSGKHSSTHHIHGIIWERDDASFPKFQLSPEGWFSKLGQLFGSHDIDFEDSPEFSDAYRLRGGDEAAIRQLFTPEIRRFFAATPDQCVTGGGRFLFWWKGGHLPPVEQLDEWLEKGDHARRRFFTS